MRIFIPAPILFTAASMETGLAATFEMALLFHVLTGAASAEMLSVAFVIASDTGEGAPTRCIA